MKVKVLCLGRAAKEVELAEGANVEQAIVESGFPKDQSYNRHVNGNHAMDSDTLQDGKVHISGNTNDVNDYVHPHISDNICWGNIGSTISKLIGQIELHGLFSLIHNFLGSYNADDPYQRIERWNPDWEDEDDYSDEPFCIFCDDYGHEVEQCEYCHWCDDCDQWVDHPEDECPTRKEAEHEQAA